MSLVVPAKPRRRKLQLSYKPCSRRLPRIYVEYLDENGAVIQAVEPPTPPNTAIPQNLEDVKPIDQTTTNTKKAVPTGSYTSHDAATQTDFFWCACPTTPVPQSQPQSAKKHTKDKDSTAIAQEMTYAARKAGEVRLKHFKASKSEADVLALIEEATRGKPNSSKGTKGEVAAPKVEKPTKKSEKKEPGNKHPEKKQSAKKQTEQKQPNEKQPEKRQSGKKYSEKQHPTPLPPKHVHFTHLPRFSNPHRDPASSSSSSATDESNIDPDFAAFMAQAPPPGYVSQMQEPELYGTPTQYARYQDLRQENDIIRRSIIRADNMERVRKINEEAVAERADEVAAQEWLRERNAASEKAAAAWLGERQAVRSQEKGETPHYEDSQAALRVADEREAERWVEQRAKERLDNSASRNDWNPKTKDRNQQNLKPEGYRRSTSPDEVVWDSTHNGHWTRPSDWANLSQPQKSSLSRPAPKIWEDLENNGENQAKRVSFATPNLPANSDPHEDNAGRFLNEMDINVSHIPPYRRYAGLGVAEGPPEYKPHSRRRSAYESLPDPIFVMSSREADVQSVQRSSDRTRPAPIFQQRHEMSGALDDIEASASTKKKNKTKVHYEVPSVASADSNEEIPNTDMLWEE
ncbi:hypothetical protein MMC18_007364 [Xylographa bjoerkii]|nr:hypothetical protein [Xylographa bjoerkii]